MIVVLGFLLINQKDLFRTIFMFGFSITMSLLAGENSHFCTERQSPSGEKPGDFESASLFCCFFIFLPCYKVQVNKIKAQPCVIICSNPMKKLNLLEQSSGRSGAPQSHRNPAPLGSGLRPFNPFRTC